MLTVAAPRRRRAAAILAARVDEARGEVEFSARILDYYARNAERFLAPVQLKPTIGKAHMEMSPRGSEITMLQKGRFFFRLQDALAHLCASVRPSPATSRYFPLLV